jgi:5'-nucleotidase
MRGRQKATNGRRAASCVLAIAGCALATAAPLGLVAAPDQPVTLSIVGTTDLHGEAFGRNGLGGLPLLGGYVNNLRAARASDGGAVLLIDAGDTFQGNIASNLSEGAVVVDAYNAMRYTAQAIGNHDFDFGSVDSATARQVPGDLRGALQARAAQARYPFLAANLIDTATGRPVEWPNVRPSAVVDAAGVKVGIVGVMTIDALRSTVAANVQGLRIAPLQPTIAAEASKLRAAGADVVIVASHAGGRCDRFDRATDLSSCDPDSEIFQLARSLPKGLVDVIVAGHTHAGLGHEVEGIGIIQAFSRGQSFARVDILFDRSTRRVARLQPFAPRQVCAWQDAGTQVRLKDTTACAAAGDSPVAAEYEGRPVAPDPAVSEAMEPALARVRRLRAVPLGLSLDEPIPRVNGRGSPLGRLVAAALRDAVPGADLGAINNAGRLWADLPRGPITFGQLYDVFPFDNRLVRVTLSGAELARWIASEVRQGRGATLALSGIEATARCLADGLHVDLRRGTRQIEENENLVGVTIGAPTLNGNLASADFLGGPGPTENNPVAREVVEDWFRRFARMAPAERDHVLNRQPEFAGDQLLRCITAPPGRGIAPGLR